MHKRILLSLFFIGALAFSACEDDDNGGGDPTPAVAPDTLESSYDSAVTLTNNPDAPVDYVGMSKVTFRSGSELTVEPGVVIAFNSGVQVRFAPGSTVQYERRRRQPHYLTRY